MVISMMDLSDETRFTLVRDYATVITDHIGYHEDIATLYKHGASGEVRPRALSVSDADVLKDLKNNRTFSKKDSEIILQYVQLMEVVQPLVEVKDTAKLAAVFASFKEVLNEVEDFDKEGSLALKKAPSPQAKSELVRAINGLL